MNYVTLLFLLMISVSVFANDLSLSIKENVFKIIPINTYAFAMSTERARERYQEECAFSYQSLTIDKRMNCDVLKSCEGDQCISEHSPAGTAFLVDGGKTLMTALHVVYSTHNLGLTLLARAIEIKGAAYKRKALSGMRPEFLLLNYKDEIIFDSRDNHKQDLTYKFWGDPLAISFQLQGSRLDKPFGFFGNAPYDYVGIELPFALGSGLKLTSGHHSPSLDHLSGVGYPAAVKHNGEIKNSKLSLGSFKELYKKVDHFLEFQKQPSYLSDKQILEMQMPLILSIMGYTQEQAFKQILEFDHDVLVNSVKTILKTQKRILLDIELDKNKKVIAFDGNILIGQSGGPILNQDNEVVGIITNNLFNKYNGGVGVLINSETHKKRDYFIKND